MSPFPPTPAEPVLKPRDLGQLLDQTFKVFTRSWRSLIPIGLLAAIPSLLQSVLTLWLMPGLETGALNNPLIRLISAVEYGDYSGLVTLGVSFALFALVLLFLFPLYQGALIDVSTRAVLQMPPVSMGESLRVGAARYWPMLGTYLLLGLVWIVAMPLLVLAGLVVLAFLTVPAGLLALAVFTAFTGQAIIIEGAGGATALRRSFELAKSRFWPLLGIGIVFNLLTMVLTSIIVSPFSFATGLAVAALEAPSLMAIPALMQGLATAVITPFMAVGLTLTYFDTRIRREGYDLEVMAQQQQPPSPFEPRP